MTIDDLEQQEYEVRKDTENFYGINRNGFCDYALDGVELLWQGISYLRNVDKTDISKDWENFNIAIRSLSWFHYYRITFTFKSIYNLALSGYYTESAILLRHVLETFIRLRYILKSKNIELVNLAFAGHYGYKGRKFPVRYKHMFDDIAPGIYKEYQLLCDFAHGAGLSTILKTDIKSKNISLDGGVVFRPYEVTYILNQYTVYLLAHLELMMWIWPEIKSNVPEIYSCKYKKLLSLLWKIMDSFEKMEKIKIWYKKVQNLIIIKE